MNSFEKILYKMGYINASKMHDLLDALNNHYDNNIEKQFEVMPTCVEKECKLGDENDIDFTEKHILNELGNKMIDYINFYYQDDYSKGIKTIKAIIKVLK